MRTVQCVRLVGVWGAIAVSLLLTVAGAQGVLYDTRITAPMRFTYQQGSAPLDQDTSWKTLIPFVLEGTAYASASSIPVGFSVRARLVFECNSAEVYPGNTFTGRAWVEPEEDPDSLELYSNYGFEFGVLVRNPFVKCASPGYTKDFAMRIEANGALPLGENYLGGIDTVECGALPLTDMLGKAQGALSGALKAILEDAGDLNISVASVSLAGEMVLEGEMLTVSINGTSRPFTGYGVAHAQTYTLYVPLAYQSQQVFTFDAVPYFHYNLYQAVGIEFVAVGPLRFTLAPQMVARGFGTGDYEPPSSTLLHSGLFSRALDGGVELADCPVVVAIAMTNKPPMPDIAVTEIIPNPHYLGSSFPSNCQGRVYAGEVTRIAFRVVNQGQRDTMRTGDFRYYVDIDDVPKAVPWQWINNPDWVDQGLDGVVLQIDQSFNERFAYAFAEGPHDLSLHVGYLDEKLPAQYPRIFGLGDANTANNVVNFRIQALPPRGTVRGRVYSSPDTPSGRIVGIPVRLTGPDFFAEAVSHPGPGEDTGIYSFANVPTGDYELEYLPPPPTGPSDPWYWPRSFVFHHHEADVDLFDPVAGGHMLQFQRLQGTVTDLAGTPLSDVTVSKGAVDGLSTNSGTLGTFVFEGVPPRGKTGLRFSRDDLEPRSIEIDMAVNLTAQRETVVQSYVDTATGVASNDWRVRMRPDSTPPGVEIESLTNHGAVREDAQVVFRATDTNGNGVVRHRALVYNGPTPVGIVGWTDFPAGANGMSVTGAVSVSGLAQGNYELVVQAVDTASHTGASPRVAFVYDTIAPEFSVSLDTGALVTARTQVDIDVTVTNGESGMLQAWLSADGSGWDGPYAFSPPLLHVPNWPLLPEGAIVEETKVVQVRVSDAAGNQHEESDAIDVDTSGQVQLAGGAAYAASTNVPIRIDIVPPDGTRTYREPSYMTFMELGSSISNRNYAQTIVTAVPLSGAEVRMHIQVSGAPGRVHVKLLDNLSPTDPFGGNEPSAPHWSGSAEDVESCTLNYGYVPATFSQTLLPAGTNYLLVYAEGTSTSHYYRVENGKAFYGGNGNLCYHWTGTAWAPVYEFGMPIEAQTVCFELWDSQPGLVRVTVDGVCDTEPWETHVYPPDPLRTVTFPGRGPRTVSVQYTNASNHAKDGYYLDSIIIDPVPPTLTTTVARLETHNREAVLRFEAADDIAGVEYIFYSLDGGNSWPAVHACTETVAAYTAPFETVLSYAKDRAGNVSGICTSMIPQDVFAPSFQFMIDGGSGYTHNTNVVLHLMGSDGFGVGRYEYRAVGFNPDYLVVPGSVSAVTVALPRVTLNFSGGTEQTHADGLYTYLARAIDTSGNVSSEAVATVVLDRTPPEVAGCYLTDWQGRAFVRYSKEQRSVDLRGHLHVVEAVGPLSLRFRRSGAPGWSAWQPLPAGSADVDIFEQKPDPDCISIDFEVRDGAGSVVSTCAVIEVNSPPETPVGLLPDHDVNMFTIILRPIGFVDADSDVFSAARFQVFDNRGALVHDSGAVGEMDYPLDGSLLKEGGEYTWQTQQMDNYGLWSEWSEWLAFTPTARPDTDLDGIPDEVENDSCTSAGNPDSDGDGVWDGVEDVNRDGCRDPGETDPCVFDSDGDGLSDGVEDANANGRRDPGETDACRWDSDGDGSSDGHEALAGTDPLDGSSTFVINSFHPVADVTGGVDLMWQSRSGRLYRVCLRDAVGSSNVVSVSPWLVATGGVSSTLHIRTNLPSSSVKGFYDIQIQTVP